MKPKLLLRTASVIMLLHTVGHTFGALGWKNAPNAAVAAVIAGMQREHFDFMGRSSTIADFYEGYGFINIFVLLLLSVLLWLLSGHATNPAVRNMSIVLGIFLVIMSVCEYIYFFPLAAIMSLIAGVCALLARGKFFI
jgi:cellulose synthase/poly-beta-1,6-N-acetylglucosamine synthase-like glycosyltransferase